MSSRDKILGTVKSNQPGQRELPALPGEELVGTDLSGAFIAMVEAIGGSAYRVSGFDRIATILREQYPRVGRIVSGCPELAGFAETGERYADPHVLEDVGLAVLGGHFWVAENGGCWITEDRKIERALPFIAQHLALVIRYEDIVANMHETFDRIGALEAAASYGFATFIAGPSKTADIEQSLVLGAHGPRSLTVFLIDAGLSDAGFY